ncbi:hypothetical protein ACFX2I_013240 [Malus domestica]
MGTRNLLLVSLFDSNLSLSITDLSPPNGISMALLLELQNDFKVGAIKSRCLFLLALTQLASVGAAGKSLTTSSEAVEPSAANRMTGTPACTRVVVWSVMATVLEALTELTCGLRKKSTSTWVWSWSLES